MELFAKIVKLGLTFKTTKGNLSPQEIWKLPLTGNNGFNLDETSKTLLKKIREVGEESLVSDSDVNTNDQLRLEVLKFIIADKKSEIKAKEKAAINATHNAKIDAMIAEKQDEALKELSLEELLAMKK